MGKLYLSILKGINGAGFSTWSHYCSISQRLLAPTNTWESKMRKISPFVSSGLPVSLVLASCLIVVQLINDPS
jgi:hypothetical protein